jgi:serine/threonine protein kinase
LVQHGQAGRAIAGRYRLISSIGSGGFGRVWKAHDEELDVDVAVKEVWLPPSADDREQTERLQRAQREARNAARLREHPNIVTVHDVIIEDDVPWLVMQLVGGQSLQERLQDRGPMSVDEVVGIATGMFNALEAAHSVGVVHRDVKPANVLLADNGDILLADFGIAVHQTDTSLTESGMFIGSLEYMAPERLNGTDRAAGDLFSLGVTLYQAVEGASPFRRDTPTATLTAVLMEQAPLPKRAGRLTPVITRLLDKDPAKRPTIPQARAMILPATKKVTTQPKPTPVGPVFGWALIILLVIGFFVWRGQAHSTASNSTPRTTDSSAEFLTTDTTTDDTTDDSTTDDTTTDDTTTNDTTTADGLPDGCSEAFQSIAAFNKLDLSHANDDPEATATALRQLANGFSTAADNATDANVSSALETLVTDYNNAADAYERRDAATFDSIDIHDDDQALLDACRGTN